MLRGPTPDVHGFVAEHAEALGLAVVLGLLLGHGLTKVAGIWLQSERSLSLTGWTWLAAEGWIVLLGLGVGLVAALLPAWGAYRLDVTTLLQSRS